MKKIVDNEWMQHIPDSVIPVKADQNKYSIPNENEIGFHSNPVGVKLDYGLYSPGSGTDEWKLLIRKNVNEHAFKTDEEALQFQYNVQDYLFKSYQFCYEDEDLLDKYAEMEGTLSEEQLEQFHLEPIPNPLLTQGDVRDYYLDTRGIWYVRNDVLYYMDAGAKLNIKICEVKNAIMMMPVSESQDLVITMQVTTLQDVRQTVQNRGYPGGKLVHKFFTKGIYEGYEDEYIISVRYEEINVASIVAERMEQLLPMLEQEGVPPKQSALGQQQTKGRTSQNDCYEKNTGENADMGEIEKWTSKMKPQGTERYFRIDSICDHTWGVRMRDKSWNRKWGEETWNVSFTRWNKSVLIPDDTRWQSIQTDVALYGDKMYVVNDGYLCVTAIGETQNKGRVLAKAQISCEKLTPLVANDYGIFTIDAGTSHSDSSEAQILWFTHEGNLVKDIKIPGDVQETYICGKTLFYLKVDNEALKSFGGCSAYWMDMETEEEHRIIHAQGESKPAERFSRWMYVKHIFGNERGAVLLICFVHEHDVEDGCNLQQSGWYYYDLNGANKISCLSNSQNDPHSIYTKPKAYERWIEECLNKYGYDPYYINIMAFDMEKNLMWVSKEPNGDGSWEPMNITKDLQKRKRPDLPVWNMMERIEALKQSNKIYFDGKRCYTYIEKRFLDDYFGINTDGYGDSFCSIDAKGRIERWPVRTCGSYTDDFMVLGEYVRISTLMEGESYGLGQAFPFHYFPASHEYQKLLCTEDTDHTYCVYDMRWMIREYMKKQRAVEAEDDRHNLTEADDDDWVKVPTESDDEDTTVSGHTDSVPTDSAAQLEYWEGFSSYADSFGLNPALTMAKLAGRTWQALRMKPSYIRIECSFSARKNSLRTAFIVEGHPEVFAQAERICDAIDRELQSFDITWDGESNAANINLTTSIDGMSRAEQYNWFCRAAEALYDAVRLRLDV